jgi:hypothetical protein
MASSDRTDSFVRLRLAKSGLKNSSSIVDVDGSQWIGEQEFTRFQTSLQQLQSLFVQQQNAIQQSLKISFAGREEDEKLQWRIEDYTNQIAQLIQTTQGSISTISTFKRRKLIPFVSSSSSSSNSTKMELYNEQYDVFYINLCRHLEMKLQIAIETWRRIQLDSTKKRKEQEMLEQKNNQLHGDLNNNTMIDLDVLEEDENKQGNEMINDDIEVRITRREQKILKLSETINDILTISKQLQSSVVLNGTILDRIDYNIETSLYKIVKGNKNLQSAEKYQLKGSKCKNTCLFMLLAIVVVLVLVLALKISTTNNST